MAALATEAQFARRVTVEAGAEVDKLVHPIGALAHENVHRIRVTKTGARDQRVFDMENRGIVLPQNTGDSALCPVCVGVGSLFFCDDGDGARAACRERISEARASAANYEKIKFFHFRVP
jgi:hypothetical protein